MRILEKSGQSSAESSYKKPAWPGISSGKQKALEFQGILNKITEENKGKLIEIAPGIYSISKNFKQCSEQKTQKADSIITQIDSLGKVKSDNLLKTIKYLQGIEHRSKVKAYPIKVYEKNIIDYLA